MGIETLPSATPGRYSIEMIQDEIRQMLEKGTISRQQPIYTLCQYIPAREWVYVEYELERQDYLLRDRIGDLIGSEIWSSD